MLYFGWATYECLHWLATGLRAEKSKVQINDGGEGDSDLQGPLGVKWLTPWNMKPLKIHSMRFSQISIGLWAACLKTSGSDR